MSINRTMELSAIAPKRWALVMLPASTEDSFLQISSDRHSALIPQTRASPAKIF